MLVAGTLAPIYLSYTVPWLDEKFLGRPIDWKKMRKLHVANAKKFYAMATRMGGAMIKVGQIISTRADIMPREWVVGLSGLQDSVNPAPWSAIEPRLREELGDDPDRVFKEIDHESVAAASFGQVHRATTHDGQKIALKIKHADIDWKLDIDMKTLRIAVPLFNIFIPKIKLKAIYQEVGEALTRELNYEREAEHTRIIGKNLTGVPYVHVPKVLDDYTTGSVICTTWFDGEKVSKRKQIMAAGLDLHELINIIIYAYTRMIFADGVFQSDPHPGNLLYNVDEDGDPILCILDFGQVKMLPPDFQSALMMSAMAFMGRDVRGFEKSLVDLGLVSAKDAERARPLLEKFFDEYFELSPADLQKLDLRQVGEDVKALIDDIDGIHIPTDLVLYGRTFSLLAGVVTQLDRNVNGLMLARPMIMQALTNPAKLTMPGYEARAEAKNAKTPAPVSASV